MMEVVIKPIKDGISGWVRDIGNKVADNFDSYSSNPSQGFNLNGVSDIIFGTFTYVLLGLISVIEAVITLVSPFLSLVSGLLKDVIKFVVNIITNTLVGGGKREGTLGEDGWGSLTSWVYNYIGIKSSSQSKSSDAFLIIIGGFVGALSAILSSVKVLINAKPALKKVPGSSGKFLAAVVGLIMTFVTMFAKNYFRKIDILIIGAMGMAFAWWGFMNVNSGGCFGAIALGVCIASCLISTLKFAIYSLELFNLSEQNKLDLFSSA